MYVLSTQGSAAAWGSPPGAQRSILLEPLETAEAAGTLPVRFSLFATLPPASPDSDVFERVLEVAGHTPAVSGFAVTAEWQIDDPAHEASFRDSRQLLFEARRTNLPSFAFDWLLRGMSPTGGSPTSEVRYLVIGVYGTETDLRQARTHPEIQRIAAAHPPAAYTARDLTGMRFYRLDASRESMKR